MHISYTTYIHIYRKYSDIIHIIDTKPVKYSLHNLHLPPVAIFIAHFLQVNIHRQGLVKYTGVPVLQKKHFCSLKTLTVTDTSSIYCVTKADIYVK